MVGELGRRQIDRDPDMRPASRSQMLQRAAGVGEHIAGQPRIVAAALDQRQEFARTDYAMFRMAPADQRFQADDVVAFEIDLALIPDLELPLVEASGNGKFEVPAAAI